MKALAALLFEHSPWGPFWTSLAVGFSAIGLDGQVYLTASGQEYLEGLE